MSIALGDELVASHEDELAVQSVADAEVSIALGDELAASHEDELAAQSVAEAGKAAEPEVEQTAVFGSASAVAVRRCLPCRRRSAASATSAWRSVTWRCRYCSLPSPGYGVMDEMSAAFEHELIADAEAELTEPAAAGGVPSGS